MDYLELFRRHGITLQTGGSDQWGNLLSGVELIRKAEGVAVHALDHAADHQGGRHQVRQDRDRHRLARPRADEPVRVLPVLAQRRRRRRGAATSRSSPSARASEIDELAAAVADAPAAREAQRALAYEVTSLVHGPRRRRPGRRGEPGAVRPGLAGRPRRRDARRRRRRAAVGAGRGRRRDRRPARRDRRRGEQGRRATGDRRGRRVGQQRPGRRRGRRARPPTTCCTGGGRSCAAASAPSRWSTPQA